MRYITKLFTLTLLGAVISKAQQPVMKWSMDQVTENLVIIEGPTNPPFPALPASNPALYFDGNGQHLPINSQAALQFHQGDTISIDGWVKIDSLQDGKHAYIIGKGRTHADRDNQNWALRVTGSGGQAKISFLFRSQATEEHEPKFHRWTATTGFPFHDWYHVAISYTFGKPKSIIGYVDGLKSGGKWDLGGATTRPPVVDDDAVWIGSARGGGPGNSFHGGLDEIAIYREKLDEKAIAERSAFMRKESPPNLESIAPGKTLSQIHEGAGSPNHWPRPFPGRGEELTLPNFALVALPKTYLEGGARMDRKLPLLLRLASQVALPQGDYELLFRAPGKARLEIDGEQIASIGSFTLPRDAHTVLVRKPNREVPKLPIGCRETLVEIHANGQPKTFLAETLLGRPGLRLTMNPFLVAVRKKEPGSTWHLLGHEGVPFAEIPFHQFSVDQQTTFAKLNAERRKETRAAVASNWQARHDRARAYVDSLPKITIPLSPKEGSPIDRFLLAKAPESRTDSHTLLKEHCARCHGEKSKGGLRLDSLAAAQAGGDSGEPAIVPKQPNKSQVLHRIQSQDPDERMPPKGEGLSELEIETLRQWIADGATPSSTKGDARIAMPPLAEPLTRLRRLYLDTLGILPPSKISRQMADDLPPTKWIELVDQLLDDPRHADHWVSYWQDVLAENPRLVKGKLNNTGPFRWWIHESVLDGKPFDQFVRELVTFTGSDHLGGAGGFGLATENDVPMAAKAHVLGTAFLGMEMKCARCHDAPYHRSTQKDLFSIAAMLEKQPIKLPESSTVPTSFFSREPERKPLIQATLKPGEIISNDWPFTPHEVAQSKDSRQRLADEITHPANQRFAQVIVNRIWKRYFGEGFVEPVHDWEGQTPSHPTLLDYLAREFVSAGYDLRHIHRLILTSQAYQREARIEPAASAADRHFEAPLRRRLTAEQLVDSLFAATGVPFYSEELSFDPEGAHPPDVMQNLGTPQRAWQMNAVSSERDRPSLTLPLASSILDVMEAFGWRSNRSEPINDREVTDSVRQPSILGNGVFGLWQTRLSDYSDLTVVAVSAESPTDLIEELYLRFLTRLPTPDERQIFLGLIEPGFETRLTQPDEPFVKALYVPEVKELSWATHLNVEANFLAAEIEERATQGPPPTSALDADWRERVEDFIWALINSPEIPFTP